MHTLDPSFKNHCKIEKAKEAAEKEIELAKEKKRQEEQELARLQEEEEEEEDSWSRARYCSSCGCLGYHGYGCYSDRRRNCRRYW